MLSLTISNQWNILLNYNQEKRNAKKGVVFETHQRRIDEYRGVSRDKEECTGMQKGTGECWVESYEASEGSKVLSICCCTRSAS